MSLSRVSVAGMVTQALTILLDPIDSAVDLISASTKMCRFPSSMLPIGGTFGLGAWDPKG
jgi:hypothetical protein